MMTFRRRGWGLVPWYLYLAFCWGAAGVFSLAFVLSIFLRDRWNAERTITVVLMGVLAGTTIRIAFSQHAWIRQLRAYWLVLDDRGVRMRLPDTGEVVLPWSEIESVTREKRWLTFQSIWAFGYRTFVYTIASRDGSLSFTNMEIPGAAPAAREITAALAARVGGEQSRT